MIRIIIGVMFFRCSGVTDQPLPGTTGGAFTLEYVRPLIPLRTGVGPFVYTWKICILPFLSMRLCRAREYHLSYGVEFYQELKFLYGGLSLILTPGVSLGYNRDGNGFITGAISCTGEKTAHVWGGIFFNIS